MYHMPFKTMKLTDVPSSAVVKAPCTLLTDVPNPGRLERRLWITSIEDYDWMKTPIAVCGLATVFMLLTGGIQLVKQDYNNWAMASDEFSFGIDSMWGEKVSSWSWRRLVEISCRIYEFNPKMTTTSKCRYSWLEPLYFRVNVDRWANPFIVAIILTVLSLIFGNFGLKIMIRRKRKEESVSRGELSSMESAEETSETISRDAAKKENVHRESEDDDEKTKENVHCESKVEDEKTKENFYKESKVQDEKSEENVFQESEVEDEKTEEIVHRGSEFEDERTDENVRRGSKVEDEKTEEIVHRGSEVEDEKNDENFHRGSEVEDEKTEENVSHESKVEEEKAEKYILHDPEAEEKKTKENIHQESEVEDAKAKEDVQHESEIGDEKTEENIHQESKVEEETKSQLITFHNLFNEWKHGEALAVLEKIQSSNIMIEIWKVRCLVKMKRTKDAKNLLLEQLEKDEENREFLLELGYLSLLMKDFEKSQDCFEKVLVLSTEGNSSWKMAMTGLMSIENTPKTTFIDWEYYALMILALANVLVEKKWLYFCGMASAQRGNFSRAKIYFNEVMLRGGFRLAWTRRAFCCVATGDFEDALEDFQRLLHEVGTFSEVVDLLERINIFVVGECPYKVLSISEKDTDKKTKEAFAQLISGAIADHEKVKIRRAFARLSDYTFKLQYDALRNEILKYAPNQVM